MIANKMKNVNMNNLPCNILYPMRFIRYATDHFSPLHLQDSSGDRVFHSSKWQEIYYKIELEYMIFMFYEKNVFISSNA